MVLRFSRALRTATAVALMTACVGCSGGGGLFSSSAPTYDLTAPRGFPPGRGGRGQLIVAEPAALSIFDSEKIVVRPSYGELGYLPSAQWVDRLPRLMQERLVQTFENANRLRAVGRSRDRLTADFQLVTDVRAFQISFADGTAGEVEISAKIVSERGGRILAARVFRTVVPAASSEGVAGISALDEAFQRVAIDVVLWTARLI